MALRRIVGTAVILIIASYLYQIYNFFKAPDIPELLDTSWGKNLERDTKIHPFKIEVTKDELNDLYLRLNLTRKFTPALEDTQHEYGLNTELLSNILKFIKEEYNFTQRQNYLNQYPQYTTQIQGLKIHFLHITPTNHDVPILPLLLLHGWPSSVLDYYKLIPILQNSSNDFNFELVIPSLPGFGYSEGSSKPNFQAPHVGNIMKNLMSRLGHEKFYVHGSDWGAIVASGMATLFPEKVLGFHSNFCISVRYISFLKIILGSFYPRVMMVKQYESKLYPLMDLLRFYFAESGYLHMQGTKPDTIGSALEDSPAGLLAFMLEKLSVGTNKHNIYSPTAGLEKFEKHIVLDSILFYYWFPKSATTAARFYAENLSVGAFKFGVNNIPIQKDVPCGCTFFENDFLYQPESILRDKFTNLIHYTTYDRGGHFSALEEPELLAKDIILFISNIVKNTSSS